MGQRGMMMEEAEGLCFVVCLAARGQPDGLRVLASPGKWRCVYVCEGWHVFAGVIHKRGVVRWEGMMPEQASSVAAFLVCCVLQHIIAFPLRSLTHSTQGHPTQYQACLTLGPASPSLPFTTTTALFRLLRRSASHDSHQQAKTKKTVAQLRAEKEVWHRQLILGAQLVDDLDVRFNRYDLGGYFPEERYYDMSEFLKEANRASELLQSYPA